MKTFRYRAVTADDRAEAGLIDANDLKDAGHRLLERGLYPLAVSAGSRSIADILATRVDGKRLSGSESAQLLADLGHLISAGVEIAPALAIMSSTKSRPRVHDAVAKLVEKVREGCALSDSMADLGLLFPPHVIAVVRAGEVSGSLGPALIRLSDSQRRATRLRSQI